MAIDITFGIANGRISKKGPASVRGEKMSFATALFSTQSIIGNTQGSHHLETISWVTQIVSNAQIELAEALVISFAQNAAKKSCYGISGTNGLFTWGGNKIRTTSCRCPRWKALNRGNNQAKTAQILQACFFKHETRRKFKARLLIFVCHTEFFDYQKLKKFGQTTQFLLLRAVLCQLTLEKGRLRYQIA